MDATAPARAYVWEVPGQRISVILSLEVVDRLNLAVLEGFLPQQMTEAAMAQAIDAVIAATGAASIKDMGKVMAALRAEHAATLDMAKAGPMVKARLS